MQQCKITVFISELKKNIKIFGCNFRVIRNLTDNFLVFSKKTLKKYVHRIK